MQSQMLFWEKHLDVTLPLSHQQPFLKALEHIEFGSLVLVTPDGGKLEFAGRNAGPAAHMKLYDWRVLDDLVARGEMGIAEAYISGRWSSDHLANVLTFGLMNTSSLERFFHGKPWYVLASYLRQLFRKNSLLGSRRNIMAHYDLGNDFYALWLDKGMTYSCALFEDEPHRSLETAQAAKYARIISKLGARPGAQILELGCGWGGFAEAAGRAGYHVRSLTISKKQAHYATERIRHAGLQETVEILFADYRTIQGQYDHIVSIGMFEHVGERYWPTYFETVKRHLKPSGTAMIQSITLDDALFESLHGYSGFVEQVIFPGGMLPSTSRFRSVAASAGLLCRDTFTFGNDYIRTLQHWLDRFHAHQDEIKALGYDEAFIRLWRFYLSACIAAFTSHRTNVMQVKLTHAA